MSVTYYYDTANGLTSAANSTTSGNIVGTGEVMLVTSGSTVSSPVLTISSVDLGSGTAATAPAGTSLVYNGGNVVATVSGVSATLGGGGAIVTSGGSVVSANVGNGAALFVQGGTASGTILNGGLEFVFSGGVASGSALNAGTEAVYNGGTVSTSTINAGAYQEVYSGGTSVSAGVTGFGQQEIQSGGTASGAIVYGGGVQTVHAGGKAVLDNITGGDAIVSGAIDQSTIANSGTETILSGGVSTHAWIISGGDQIVSGGGVATGANVQILGTQTVAAGGRASGTTISGGLVAVQSGGVLDSTYIAQNGEIVVSGGGLVTASVAAAGLVEVLSGGTVSGITLPGGQEILRGGTANATDVQKGGSIVVLAGGTANGTYLEAGGSVTVFDGGVLNGLTAVGGAVSLSSQAKVTGEITLAAAGVEVQFIGSSLAAATIKGLMVGDSIDLANIAGGVSASYANGAVTVLDAQGHALASILVDGAPTGALAVGADSGSGTLVTIGNFSAAGAAAAYKAGGLSAGAQIVDSAANIGANIDALGSIAGAGKLLSVGFSDSGFANLSISAAQATADSAALSKLWGNFTLTVDASSAGNATLTGLSGHATVISYSGTASQYTVAAPGDGSVTVTGSSIGTDHLSGITAIKFSDATEIVASAAHTGTILSSLNIAELYSAALNRAPDVAGLNYYENLIKANPSLSGLTVAEYFLSSPEYTAAHNYAQTSAGDAQFVGDLYTNILHRTGSSAEIAYYQTIINKFTTGLTAGTAAYSQAELQAHAQVLQYFSASAEFLSDIQITAAHPASASHWLLVV